MRVCFLVLMVLLSVFAERAKEDDDSLLRQVWSMVNAETAVEVSRKLIDDKFEYMREGADYRFSAGDSIEKLIKMKSDKVIIIDIQNSASDNVTALCSFLEMSADLKVPGYILLSLGSAAHGSPFHPAIARRLESDCDFVKGNALSALERLLYDPKLRRWFLSQHFPIVTDSATRMRQRPGDPAVGDLGKDSRWILHPKLHHVPLGLPRIFSKKLEREEIWLRFARQKLFIHNISFETHRSPLPYINYKPRPYRQAVTTIVSQNFNLTQNLHNHYVGKQRVTTRDKSDTREYLQAMFSHRFVLSPPGSGVDCYRHWEAILCGAIPIIEYTPIALELFSHLPVLIVRSWHEINPDFLNAFWSRTMRKKFSFRSLSSEFWRWHLHRAKETPPSVLSHLDSFDLDASNFAKNRRNSYTSKAYYHKKQNNNNRLTRQRHAVQKNEKI